MRRLSRLIDVNKLRNRVQNLSYDDWTQGAPTSCAEAYLKIVDMINNMPTVGHWIKMSDADGYYYACSECGEELHREWSFDREFDTFPRLKSIDKTRYCPHCGVKMDEVEDE